jgi:hypothetical protein
MSPVLMSHDQLRSGMHVTTTRNVAKNEKTIVYRLNRKELQSRDNLEGMVSNK